VSVRTLLLSAAVFLASLAVPATLVSAQESSTPAEGATAAAPAPAEDPQPDPEPSPSPAAGGDEPTDGTTSEDPTEEGPPPDASENPGTQSVRAKSSTSVSAGDNFFDPASITIAVGDTVTWRNDGQVAHTVTANGGSFDSGNLNPGQSFAHTFSGAGTFRYFCQYHAGMTGTIKVTSSSPGGGGGGGGGGAGSSGSTSTSGAADAGTAGATGPGSESAAGASPGAAGSGTQLPSTGAPLAPLAAVGTALVCLGAVLRRRTEIG
jgi:plastocyanin